MRDYYEEAWERKQKRKIEQRQNSIRLFLILVLFVLALMVLSRLDTVIMQQTETLNQLMELRQELDTAATEFEPQEFTAVEYMGEFTVTHYCDCPICCGKWSDGITATGTVATPGRTVVVDPSVIPLGSQVLIDGHTYIAEDTGSAIKGNRLDVFVATHEEGISRGRVERGVYLVNE